MEKKIYPSDAQERFMVRLPDGMRSKIAEKAKENGRSMNAEIVTRLDATLSDPWANQLESGRRKRELVHCYLDWCIRHKSPPHLSFVLFTEAYAAALTTGEGDLHKISTIDELDPEFLSDLYFEWETKNQSRHRNTLDQSDDVLPPEERFSIPLRLRKCRSEDLIHELLRRFGGQVEISIKSPRIENDEDSPT